MDQPSTYRHSYDKKRLDEAYQSFVRGEASLRELVRSSKVSLRTLQRYSTRDGWVEEMEGRMASQQAEVAQLSQMAAMTTEVAPEHATMADSDAPTARGVILGVLKRQQTFWDRINARITACFDSIERKAAAEQRDVSLGQMIPLLKAAEIASANVRKAYGIPDVTRVEWEDKTPAAELHAKNIQRRRDERMAATLAAAPVPTTTSDLTN